MIRAKIPAGGVIPSDQYGVPLDPNIEIRNGQAVVRQFSSGATRDQDAGKFDYEGFLSPLVLNRYAEYMHGHRKQPDGQLRDSDNWQKGIPLDAYMKSGWRHFMDVWSEHRGYSTAEGLETALCATLFNLSGYLHEVLKAKHGEPGAGYAFPLADVEGD